MDGKEFFATTGPTEAQRYKLTEVIGKGSYGVVASAVDQFNNGAMGVFVYYSSSYIHFPCENIFSAFLTLSFFQSNFFLITRRTRSHQKDHQCVRPRL